MALVLYFIKESLKYFICGRKPGVGGLKKADQSMKNSNLVGRAFGTMGLAAATLELDFSASSPLSESESLLSEESEESLGDCNIHVGLIWLDDFISSFKRYVHERVFDNFLKNLEEEEPLPSFSFFGNDVFNKIC